MAEPLIGESNYDRYVMGQTMGKSVVISVHLWLEHLLLLCLRVIVPDANALFRDRGFSFPQLVVLCEAHRVFDRPVSDILRRVNALRNKCAHDIAFTPGEREMSTIVTALQQLSPPVHIAAEDYPLRRVADLLEERAIALGAITPMPSNHAMERTADRPYP